MGNKNGSFDALSDETKQLLMQRTGKNRRHTRLRHEQHSYSSVGMSEFDLELWYKAILVSLQRHICRTTSAFVVSLQDRSTKGKLSKEQMVSIYKHMSDLDSKRIGEVVDSLEKVFDEDRSGTVGEWSLSFAEGHRSSRTRLDINEFMRGFILTTKGDLQSKIDYTFRIYDENGDNQISGEEIQKMANVSESSHLQTSQSSACCSS